ncbi:MAG: SMC-Scp complex subunit ScpB, partial [Candidatus Omnitrophica bacterium]|nr:SMC-Scp complex subunit ScpB [Candidatus Omnitrophota bacterium]
IAYRQPATRAEIEQIRGVDVGGVLETLLKLGMVRITGRKEVVGRPLLYGTTREFMEHFGLKDLGDLPSLEELQGVPAELREVAGIAATESGAEIVTTAEETTDPSFDTAVHPELVEGERPTQDERDNA